MTITLATGTRVRVTRTEDGLRVTNPPHLAGKFVVQRGGVYKLT